MPQTLSGRHGKRGGRGRRHGLDVTKYFRWATKIFFSRGEIFCKKVSFCRHFGRPYLLRNKKVPSLCVSCPTAKTGYENDVQARHEMLLRRGGFVVAGRVNDTPGRGQCHLRGHKIGSLGMAVQVYFLTA